MKIKSTCGGLPPFVPTEQLHPVTLAMSINALNNVGYQLGQYIGYKETLCQVSAVRPGEVNLVSWGWVPIADCTTEVEMS